MNKHPSVEWKWIFFMNNNYNLRTIYFDHDIEPHLNIFVEWSDCVNDSMLIISIPCLSHLFAINFELSLMLLFTFNLNLKQLSRLYCRQGTNKNVPLQNDSLHYIVSFRFCWIKGQKCQWMWNTFGKQKHTLAISNSSTYRCILYTFIIYFAHNRKFVSYVNCMRCRFNQFVIIR